MKYLFLLIVMIMSGITWADDKEDKKPKSQQEDDKDKKPKSQEEDLRNEEKNANSDSKTEDGVNPIQELRKIIDLMKEIESRLNDSDIDDYTQESQKKIVEAMKFGSKAETALDDLIKKLEQEMEKSSQQPQQQTSNLKNQQQIQQQSKQTQPKDSKFDQKQLEKQKQAESKQSRPKSNKSEDAASKQPNSKKDKKEDKPTTDNQNSNLPNAKNDDKSRWGSLPPKLHQDATKVRSDVIPERWRDQLEKYREALSK